MRPIRFDAIQGLRALAASLVVYVHALMNLKDKAGMEVETDGFSMASLGVKIFFCISGFIIFTASSNLLPGIRSVGEFMRRRVLRVVPIYWIITSVYIIKLALQGDVPMLSEIVKSFLFIPYLNERDMMRPVLGVGWTLNFEMFFYAVFGLSLVFRRRAQVIVTVGVLGVLVLLRAIGVIPEATNGAAMFLYTWADPIIVYFIFGLLIGYAREVISQETLPKLSTGKAMTLSISIVLLFVIFQVSTVLTPVICVVALLICVMAPGNGGNGTVRLMKLLGDASYSTYLIHGFVLGPISRIVGRLGLEVNPFLFGLLMVALCNLAGVIVYRLIEKPVIGFFKARVNKRREHESLKVDIAGISSIRFLQHICRIRR